jgi:multidrug efflux system membrane fusion protein
MGTKVHGIVDRVETQGAPPAPKEPEKTTRRARRSFAWLWLLILGGLGYGGFRYYQNVQQQKQAAATAQTARSAPRSVPIVATPARLADMPVYLHGLGSVSPFNSVNVKSRVDGQLIAIHFTEGQLVTKGMLLAEIDPRPFEVQLQQAEGQLARDMAQLSDAKVNLARYEALWNEKVIARQQLDTQRASVGQFEGVIQSDQAAVNNARLQLSYAKITAPISGRVGLRLIDVGNIIRASDPNGLVMISQLQPIAVLFTIPADNLPPVLKKLNAGVHLRVDGYDRDDKNKIATGSLLTVDNQIDPTTGTSRLKAIFTNTDSVLFPNQFVNCRLLLDIKHNAVVVPAAAIQRGPQGSYVYIVKEGNVAAIRPVTVGLTEGNDVTIDAGLKAGEMVVIDGQDKLQDGSKVDVRTPGQGPGNGRGSRRQQGGAPGSAPGGLPSPDGGPGKRPGGRRPPA